jgi:hypothetical protein
VIKQILCEPLVHFLVIGIVLFVIYGWKHWGSGKTRAKYEALLPHPPEEFASAKTATATQDGESPP